jgi:hypothetical protein
LTVERALSRLKLIRGNYRRSVRGGLIEASFVVEGVNRDFTAGGDHDSADDECDPDPPPDFPAEPASSDWRKADVPLEISFQLPGLALAQYRKAAFVAACLWEWCWADGGPACDVEIFPCDSFSWICNTSVCISSAPMDDFRVLRTVLRKAAVVTELRSSEPGAAAP